MDMMTTRQARVAKLAMRLISLGIVKESVLEQGDTIEDLDRLEGRLNLLLARHTLEESISMTAEALRAFSEKLADAHRMAAEITVDGPTDDQVKEFKDALNELHKDIKDEQRFHASLNLLLSLKKTIPDLG